MNITSNTQESDRIKESLQQKNINIKSSTKFNQIIKDCGIVTGFLAVVLTALLSFYYIVVPFLMSYMWPLTMVYFICAFIGGVLAYNAKDKSLALYYWLYLLSVYSFQYFEGVFGLYGGKVSEFGLFFASIFLMFLSTRMVFKGRENKLTKKLLPCLISFSTTAIALGLLVFEFVENDLSYILLNTPYIRAFFDSEQFIYVYQTDFLTAELLEAIYYYGSTFIFMTPPLIWMFLNKKNDNYKYGFLAIITLTLMISMLTDYQ